MIDISVLSANPKFACTGGRVFQKAPRIWAGRNSTRLFSNPLMALPLAFTASLLKQNHSRTKSRQLRRLRTPIQSAYCTLRNEVNEICTLRNDNLYFVKRIAVLPLKGFCEEASANLLFYYNHDLDTLFFIAA